MQPQSDRLWCKEPQAFIQLADASCRLPRREALQHICFITPFDECKQLFGDDGQFDLARSSDANFALDPHNLSCQQNGAIDIADRDRLDWVKLDMILY